MTQLTASEWIIYKYQLREAPPADMAGERNRGSYALSMAECRTPVFGVDAT